MVNNKTKVFFEKSHNKHGEFYDYSLVDYKNAKIKVKIICPEHGIFEQTPDKHLQNKYPCPYCRKSKRSYSKGAKKSKEYYINKYLVGRYDKYSYKYGVGYKTVFNITCEKHNFSFDTTIDNIRQTVYNCPKCAIGNVGKQKIISLNKTIDEISILHPSIKFDFNDFVNTRSKIKCFCHSHGIFYKTVQKLKLGQGCPKCSIEKTIDKGLWVGGYNEIIFKDKPYLKNVDAYLYFLKINNGVYYKVGITQKDIKARIKSLKSKGKLQSVELLYSKKTTLYNAYLLEQTILNENYNFRIKRKWSTELFSEDISDKVLKYFL